MMWADLTIAAGQFILALALIPTMLDKDAQVPRKTSVLTASILTAFLPAFWALDAKVSVAGTALVAVGWWVIAAVRAGPGEEP